MIEDDYYTVVQGVAHMYACAIRAAASVTLEEEAHVKEVAACISKENVCMEMCVFVCVCGVGGRWFD